jgi:hypothetical protein
MLDGELMPSPGDYNHGLPARGDHRCALAIDATGVRSVIPAVVAGELEGHGGRYVSDLVDLMVGSSAGALVALLLSTPDFGGELPEQIYDSLANSKSRGLRGAIGLGGGDSALGALGERLEQTPLGAARTRVIVPVYNPRWGGLRYLDSRDPEDEKLSMRDVAVAALATPPEQSRGPLWDGGSFGGNPTLIALAALEPGPGTLLVALSGESRASVDEGALRHGGAPVLAAAKASLADLADGLAERILGRRSYVRFAPESLDPDNTPSYVLLHDLARRLIADRSADLRVLTDQLASRSL